MRDSRSICRVGGRELIRLDAQTVAIDPGLVAAAREEVLVRPTTDGPGGFRWGYLLGVDDPAVHAEMASATELHRLILDQVVRPIGRRREADFELSFLKAGAGAPEVETEGVHYDGYHVDTHTGGPGAELLRVLVNLHSEPRLFRFAAVDRGELERRGLLDGHAVDETGLHDLPAEIVAIPPFEGERLSYLTFWASVVPHVGIDTEAGYFLASFEALIGRR